MMFCGSSRRILFDISDLVRHIQPNVVVPVFPVANPGVSSLSTREAK